MHQAQDVWSIGDLLDWPWLLGAVVVIALCAYLWYSRRSDRYDDPEDRRTRSRNRPHEEPQSAAESLSRRVRDLEKLVSSLRNEVASLRSYMPTERGLTERVRVLESRLQQVELRPQPRPVTDLYAPVDRSQASRNFESPGRLPEALGREPEYQLFGATRNTVPELREVYYAPIPEDDGSFTLSDLTTERKYNSLYMFQVSSPGRATVTLFPDPDVFKTALGAPQKYLAPACNYRSSSGANPTEIKVVSTGIALLNSQRWRIQTKLEIELI